KLIFRTTSSPSPSMSRTFSKGRLLAVSKMSAAAPVPAMFGVAARAGPAAPSNTNTAASDARARLLNWSFAFMFRGREHLKIFDVNWDHEPSSRRARRHSAPSPALGAWERAGVRALFRIMESLDLQ